MKLFFLLLGITVLLVPVVSTAQPETQSTMFGSALLSDSLAYNKILKKNIAANKPGIQENSIYDFDYKEAISIFQTAKDTSTVRIAVTPALFFTGKFISIPQMQKDIKTYRVQSTDKSFDLLINIYYNKQNIAEAFSASIINIYKYQLMWTIPPAYFNDGTAAWKVVAVKDQVIEN